MSSPAIGPASRASVVAVAALVAVVAVVGVLRLAIFGWAGIAPDDARYLYVGLSTLAGDGPVTPSGNVFVLRSPLYGILLAAGGQFTEDPIDGARIVAGLLAFAALLAAVGLAWRIAGGIAAVVAAISIIAMPLLWGLLPSLRIDLAQTAGVLATLICLMRPTTRRWALGGVLLGLTILVKETVLVLVLLPLAAVGFVPGPRLVRLWLAYLAAAAAVAAWWWIVVWQQAGVIFPFNAIGVIERRGVGTDIGVDPYGVVVIAIIVAAWVVVVRRARRDYPSRLLAVGAACLVLPAVYATLNGLSTRNYAGLAVLSAVAIGVAAASLAGPVRSRLPARRPVVVLGAAIATLVAVSFASVSQASVGDPREPEIPGQVSGWLRDRIGPDERVVMVFRYHELVALELFGAADIPELSADRVAPEAQLDEYLWIGLRDQQLFAYRRDLWQAAMSAAGTRYLVLAGPHALTPDELLPALDAGRLPGIAPGASFEAGNEWARVYAVDPGLVLATPTDLVPHMSANAALAWLDLGDPGSAADRQREFIETEPVVARRGMRRVLDRLGPAACAVPVDEPGRPMQIVSADAAAGEANALCGT